MNDRNKLLKKISMNNFAMWELHIYLDTHPNDRKALTMHNEYQRKYREYVKEYEKQYGPLNMCNVTPENMWEWTNNPWPWDYKED